jgi:serine/threonine protein kinase
MAPDRLHSVPANIAPIRTIIIEEGSTHVFDNDQRPPYEHIEILGHGRGGTVDAVLDIHTRTVFARKTILLHGGKPQQEEQRKAFMNEISIIRGLGTHHHVIRVFATYYAEPRLCLILQPVADDRDLDSFIHNFRDNVPEFDASGSRQAYDNSVVILQRAFGCLANGLAFMHHRRIRHKDIKCKNILVHHGSVIYTDFGISKDFSQADSSTTDGPYTSLTQRYSAPEILDFQGRNSKSDVYSLGCVFLEILSALTGVFNIDYKKWFSHDVQRLREDIDRSTLPEPDSSLAKLAFVMMSTDREDRPSSSEVDNRIRKYPGRICDECQRVQSPYKESTIPLNDTILPGNEQLSRHTTFDSAPSLINDLYRVSSPRLPPAPPADIMSSVSPDNAPPLLPLSGEMPQELLNRLSDISASETDATQRMDSSSGAAPPVDGTRHGIWRWSTAHNNWYYAAVDSDTKGKRPLVLLQRC